MDQKHEERMQKLEKQVDKDRFSEICLFVNRTWEAIESIQLETAKERNKLQLLFERIANLLREFERN
jgi:hypothetical protein